MATHVLIVLDGGYRFAAAAGNGGVPDFTYVALVDALSAAGITVTKAHRGVDSTATPGFANFNFAALPPGRSLNEFDVLWLIGLNGVSVNGLGSGVSDALPDPQITAIANFMDAGGGVFATGDHYSLGAEMCGKIPRVRAMRRWYGEFDTASPMPVSFPRNFPPLTTQRADTTRPGPTSDYSEFPPSFIWFENQSDSNPQPIVPVPPTHFVLQNAGHDVVVYPDHMHEGTTVGGVEGAATGYNYALNATHGDTTKPEFRDIAGNREMPRVIATGQAIANASRRANSPAGNFSFAELMLPGADAVAAAKSVNTLCAYDGRHVGVGRIITGATFHHYVDINTTGDSVVTTPQAITRAGVSAQKGHGFNDNLAVFNDIKAVYVNIANWLARAKPTITLNLERSTFGQDEVTANPLFGGAIRVVVDGLKPSQFPSGPVTTGPFHTAWAPVVSPSAGFIAITPVGVSSDDPGMPDRVQRFTFTYNVQFSSTTFASQVVAINASLATPAAPMPLIDSAFFQLVTTANPFMLDLDGGNTTHWLSSDLKVFRVVAGETLHGHMLPTGASRAQALTFINALKDSISVSQFEALSGNQAASALSPLPTTTSSGANIYNFAIARVRRNGTMLAANDVRVFFRIFTSQTTAALTYNDAGGAPIEGYLKTAGGSPIALPGIAGGEWLSFPCFAEGRAGTPSSQSDSNNVKTISNTQSEKFFGVLLDTNLADGYLPSAPGGSSTQNLPTLLIGEHQCLVAQIEFSGTPILSGANPATSDKLAQRNIAISTVANPGVTASRMAMHSFEIDATPHPISQALPPDELLLDWSHDIPDDSFVTLHIPSWKAEDVVALAERLYPRHEIRAIDAHTIEMPAGGMRYIPIPTCLYQQTGVITVELPLGIKRGQRFDVSVRQITNRGRNVKIPQPKVNEITLAEAERMVTDLGVNGEGVEAREPKRGVFDLGKNRTLVTDLSVFDTDGDFALIIEHPDPKKVAAAAQEARMWRETLGAFQLGIPVSTKHDMLLYHLRLFSLMSWRLTKLSRKSRWHATMTYYVGQLAKKVSALGGNPYLVPATPDGIIPQLPGGGLGEGEGGMGGDAGDTGVGGLGDFNNPVTKGCILGVLITLLLLVAILAIYAIWGTV
jgi:hypothetical protein